MATKEGEFKRIPLASGLKPANLNKIQKDLRKGKAFVLFEEFVKNMEKREEEFSEQLKFMDKEPRQNVGKRVATLGSQEEIFVLPSVHDVGFFASVLMAYNNHWTLRTSPDDWWFCVIKKVAKAIDENSKKDVVRNFFVDHEGKKTLEVQVNSPSIYGIDYSWFFDEMSKKISQNVKVPGYVDAVTANFSTTTSVHKIASQITLMSSVQEYFDFKCMLMCGIPFVEMLGQENDWEQLLTKAKLLKNQLKPIMNEIGLQERWWVTVEKVFANLLATYQGKPHVNEWWSHIMSWEEAFGSGQDSGWTGWIVDFLEYPGCRQETSDFTGGLVTVPLTFVDPMGTEDTAALVAGMLGFTLHPEEPERPAVQPFQGWSLLLPEKSPFRQPLEE